MLPGADIHIDKLTISPWQDYAGGLDLTLNKASQQLHYRGDNLQLEATLEGQQLTVRQLTITHPALPEPLSLKGHFELPQYANGLPVNGEIAGALALDGFPQPLKAALRWQYESGLLNITTADAARPLLRLPWQASRDRITIEKGEYYWPLTAQPLSGFVTLTLDNWQAGLDATTVTGRLNLLTQGRGGKGNVVLGIGPGHLSLTQSQLPLQLTGDSKFAAMQLSGSIPGQLTGSLLNPELVVKPNALLRLRGRLLSTLNVDEARWPLAGCAYRPRAFLDVCRPFCARTIPALAASPCIWTAGPVTSGRIRVNGAGATGEKARCIRYRRNGMSGEPVAGAARLSILIPCRPVLTRCNTAACGWKSRV